MQAAGSAFMIALSRNFLNLVPAVPQNAGLARLMAAMVPGENRGPDPFLNLLSSPDLRPHVKDSHAQSRIAELLALKREDKAPENFIRDALAALHRRNAAHG